MILYNFKHVWREHQNLWHPCSWNRGWDLSFPINTNYYQTQRNEENQQSIFLSIFNPMVDSICSHCDARMDALPPSHSHQRSSKMQFKLPSKIESGEEAIHLDSNWKRSFLDIEITGHLKVLPKALQGHISSVKYVKINNIYSIRRDTNFWQA